MMDLRKCKKHVIIYLTLIILLLVKALLYYRLIDIKDISIRLSLLSLSYIVLAIAFINLFKGIKQTIILLLFYISISLIMFADATYYRYFNTLTSIVLLKQISQITAISESISEVLKPVNLLLVADIIPGLLFLYFYKKKSAGKGEAHNGEKKLLSIYLIFVAIIVLIIPITNIPKGNIETYRQEFFTYHIADAYSTFFSKEDDLDANKMLKESIDKIKNKDKYLYGSAKGKNIITIQVEGLQYFVINKNYEGQEITPNLNNLLKSDSLFFDRYYQLLGRGNTSDAEFVSHNSLYPAMDGQTYIKYYKNTFYGLPWILKEKGYNTAAYHGYKASFWNRNKAYVYQGFDRFYNGDTDYTIKGPVIGFGINDMDFFQQTVNYIKSMEEPYYAFIVTLSSHHPYNLPDELKKIKLSKEHINTQFGKYIQAINYADAALGEFIENLKIEGLYNDAIISIYGDHFGLSLNEKNKNHMTKYLGYEYNFDEMMKVPLIIHVPKSGLSKIISTTGSQLDYLPTILNILGIENKKGIMLGQDLVNSQEGFAAEQTHMQKGSYIKGDIVFLMSRDGIFKNSKAWNINTRLAVSIEDCREDYERIIHQINQSDNILRNDLLKRNLSDRSKKEDEESSEEPPLYHQRLIASYGLKDKGIFYTNPKEAIDKKVEKGYKFIELDFLWTDNGSLGVSGLSPMSMPELIQWLKKNNDIYIVSNIKKDNVDALRLIKDEYPEIISQIIPQIYRIDEFIPVQGFGCSNIILNLATSEYTNDEILDFVKRHKVYAITIPVADIDVGLLNALKDEKLFIYAETVNNIAIMEKLEDIGIDGFYTSDVLP